MGSFRITLTLALLLLFTVAYAQDNLKRGYVMHLNGEIVHGFIDVTGWGMNPSKVLFKTYPADTGTYYDPYDIKEFGMNQEVWQGGFVEVELSSRDDNNYSTTPQLIIEKDLVFLQMVIRSPKPLYVYSKAVNEQFYIKNGNEFELLVYKKYLKEVQKADGSGMGTTLIENRKYQGQLIVYFEDCPEIRKKISKTEYTLSDLESLFYEYSKCKDVGYELLSPTKNISLKLGAALGMAKSSIDFNFIDDYRIKELEPVDNNLIPFGVTLEIGRPVSNPRWSLYNELSLISTYKHAYDTAGQESATATFKDKYSFRFHSWKLTNMVRYKYPVGKFNFFANAGIAMEFYQGSWTRTYYFKSPLVSNSKIWKNKDSYFTLRPAAGVGINFRSLSIEGRYEPVSLGEYAGPTASVVLNVRF